MKWLSRFIFEHRLLTWSVLLITILLAGVFAGKAARDFGESDRLSRLNTEARQGATELMATTTTSNLMSAISMLGLINGDIKREAMAKSPANTAAVTQALESVGRSYDADGVFVVGLSGLAGSSWDNRGEIATGLNVKYHPCYQMAMQGLINVHAMAGNAHRERNLYYCTPIYVDTTDATDAIGIVVARTGMRKIDEMIRDKADIVLLMSPQGVIFSSNRKEWIGRLSGSASPERLKSLRDLKQFVPLLDAANDAVLPMSVEPGVQHFDGRRFAIAQMPVLWSDPFGDWSLVLMEDLDRSVPIAQSFSFAALVMGVLFFLGSTLIKVLQSQHRQFLASQKIAHLLKIQQTQAEHKEQVAAAAMLLQFAKSRVELCHTFLGELHRIFGALNGVVYLVDRAQPNFLVRNASFACIDEPAMRVTVGEGLVGQCAADRQPKLITDIPPAMHVIHSGLGSTSPIALLIAPIMLKEDLLGVVEIALLTVPDESDHEKLIDMTHLMGMNLEIIGRSVMTQESIERLTEAECAQSEQVNFQQVLIDTIPYPVFYMGSDSRIMGVNRAYEQSFNVQRGALLGKRVCDFKQLTETERAAFQAETETIIMLGSAVRRYAKFPFADGKIHDAIYYAAGFRLNNGEPGGMLGSLIDLNLLEGLKGAAVNASDVAPGSEVVK
jgi:two-component system, NtrC family, C4-dicarboxylate transport sensor histidine kinase DctB